MNAKPRAKPGPPPRYTESFTFWLSPEELKRLEELRERWKLRSKGEALRALINGAAGLVGEVS